MLDPVGNKNRYFWVDAKLVSDFADDMIFKLRRNQHKKHWDTVTNKWLLERLKEEVKELEEALLLNNDEDVRLECADVANFAAMIADNRRNGIS